MVDKKLGGFASGNGYSAFDDLLAVLISVPHVELTLDITAVDLAERILL